MIRDDLGLATDADEWAAVQRRSLTWFTGLPQEWTDDRRADPRWGPDAVALAAAGWQQDSPLPLEVECDEFPCIVVIDERLHEGEEDIDDVIKDAFRRSQHMPPDIFYGYHAWGLHVYGVAPSQDLGEDVRTRFFWRAELEIAQRGVPEAIERIRAKHPDLDLGVDSGTSP